MKKRLLSAALALAMVLTLLPATVFAADPTTGADENPKTSVNVTYQDAVAPDGRQPGKWYWTDTSSGSTVYKAVNGGLVGGTGNSGTWYSADNDPATGIVNTSGALKTTTFTLLTALDLGSLNGIANGGADITSLIVDVNNVGLTLPSNINKLSSLTIYNKLGSNTTGTVSGIKKDTASTAAPVASLTLDVTNATITGGITLNNGVGNIVKLHNGTICQNITMNGKNKDSANNDTFTGQQQLTADGSTTISGAVSITGNSSTVNLSNVQGKATLGVNSTGGSVQVSGYTDLGKITVQSTATTAVSAQIPTVTINGGTVAGIAHPNTDTSTASASVTVKNGAVVTSPGISVKAGTVNIEAGADVDAITVPSGTLNITGGVSGTKVGAININANGKTTLNVTGGNITGGGITADTASDLTVKIPADKTNSFGNLSLGTYGGGGVLGGTYSNLANTDGMAAWFASTVRFAVKADGTNYTYYGERELAQAIADLGADAATSGNIVLVGHDNTQQVTLMNGSKTAKIGYSKPTAFYLPAVLLGDKIDNWTWVSNANIIYAPDGLFTTPSTPAAVTLRGQEDPAKLSATKLNGVSVNTSGQNYTGGIRASLVGNVITLTGAVNSDGGFTVIPLTLETDLKDASGNAITANVSVMYNHGAKSIIFDVAGTAALAGQGITLTQTTLSMNNGQNVYTLNGSGLGVPAGDLKTATTSTEIQVTVTKSNYTQPQKDALIAKMSGSNGVFTWSGSPAIVQAINAAQLTINNNTTLNNWITQAQNAVWRYGNKTGATGFNGKGVGDLKPHTTSAPTDAQRGEADFTAIKGKYSTVYLVPYLQVTVTDVNESTGYMTLTLTPSYRMVVSGTSYSDTEYYIVQAGRTLGALTGNMGTASVEFKGLTGKFATAYMHQDGTYAYKGASSVWNITHAGTNGLGSMVINGTAPTVTLKRTGTTGGVTTGDYYFDSLQAAVDDTVYQVGPDTNLDLVVVGSNYPGSDIKFDVTGTARKFRIQTQSNHTLTRANNNFTVEPDPSGRMYTVQLQKDVAPAGGNITISSATGGSASVNANPAATGQTVTITLSPNAGYTSSGVTVKTASGQTVSVSGSGNTYTFVMPSGTVTVTPSFTASQTIRKATVSVSPNSMGTTTTTAAATNNQVDAGSNVGVTTNPASGYRTMGVNISTNGGAATAVRQGDNYFTFTVPANATAVTVTPIYDRDNGTKFSDVWSTEYYSNPVAWAVGRNITNGTSTYTFSPSVTCTRAQMMTFLWRAAGRPTVSGANNPFVDVYPSMGSDYYSAILWAVSKGITNGVDSTHFGPSQTVSRAQAVTFLYRYAGSPSASTYTGFTDAPSSEYYARAVSWANAKGITNGKTSTTFAPSWGVTRAEAVTFLYRHITGLTA